MSSPSPSPSASPAAATGAAPAKAAKSKRSPLNVTGIHVLKSALISVIGAQCSTTQSTDFAHATKAEVTVSYDGETLTPDVYNQVEAKCNELIAANLLVSELPLPVGDLANCVGPRTDRTGELRILKLLKMRNRKNQKGYEFSFVVENAADELIAKNAAAVAATNSKKTQAVQQAAVSGVAGGDKKATSAAAPAAAAPKKSSSKDYVVDTTNAIFNDLFLPAIASLQSASASSSGAELTPAELATLKAKLLPQLGEYLAIFANEAYTKGAVAKTQGTGNVNLAHLL